MRASRCLFLGLVAWTALAAGAEKRAAQTLGSSFVHEQAGRRVNVRYFVPTDAQPARPVVFVLHGLGRNPGDCLKDWAPYAEQRKFIVIAPEFSNAEFPGAEGYLYGNTVDRDGRPLPRPQWSFSMLEPIFDAVRQRTGNQSSGYFLYGFSAGAQFVQRFLYFVPGARVVRTVAANAGWYMLPDLAVPFPYGLKGTVVADTDLRSALARPVTLLLGDADTDPGSPALRHTPEADTQGLHRFARGQYFHRSARSAAETLKTPCGWSLSIAPRVAHSEREMTPFAVRCLLPDLLSPKIPDTP